MAGKQPQLPHSKLANLANLANLESITFCQLGATLPPSATALVGNMEVLVPMAGIINKDEKLERLDKEMAN